jgi:hypothetical protein
METQLEIYIKKKDAKVGFQNTSIGLELATLH